MAVDIAALVLVGLLCVHGLIRGFLSQVVGIVALVGLWVSLPHWLPLVDPYIAQLGPPIDEQPYIRKIVAFGVAYVLVQLVFRLLEGLVVDSVALLRWSNRLGGGLLGAAKGVLFAVLMAWGIQAVALWNRPVGQPEPSWLVESHFVNQVGPWNPVRVSVLREIVDEVRTAVSSDRPERARELLDRLPERPELRQMVEELSADPRFDPHSYQDMLAEPRIRAVLAEHWPKNPFFRPTR